MAAPVLAHLGVPAFGIGGNALRRAGLELTTHLAELTAMGFGGVLARAPRIVHAALRLLRDARRRRPAAALLVGYSEFNALLGPRLRRRGVRVLWYGAPQIWAWRSRRAQAIARACDRLATILPFEPSVWRSHGVVAEYVGHPALERVRGERDLIRAGLGLASPAECVALLPGSRPHEVRRHVDLMLGALRLLRAERGAVDARLIIAPSLGDHLTSKLKRRARQAGVEPIDIDAAGVLRAFDVALAASGTVTLECVVADVPPVVVYKTGLVTELLARSLLRVQDIALPNLVLGERIFPELVQRQATAQAAADQASRLLDERGTMTDACARVRGALELSGGVPSERVARMMAPWLW